MVLKGVIGNILGNIRMVLVCVIRNSMGNVGLILIGVIINILRKMAAVALSSSQIPHDISRLSLHLSGLLFETLPAV